MLDSQLRRDAELTHFEYFVLAMLSESPERTLRMTLVAQRRRTPPCLGSPTSCDAWRTAGWWSGSRARRTAAPPTPGSPRRVGTRCAAAPGHVANVRQHVIDALTPEQVAQLRAIGEAILGRVDPDGTMAATYTRYDPAPERPGA